MPRTLLALLLLPLLLVACANPGTTGLGGPGGEDPKSLPNIRLYNSALGVGDYMVEVTSAGDMIVQERRGPTETDIHRSAMHLTPDQINSLQSVFKGWKQLKSAYPGEWSTLVQITYDGYTVDAHDLNQAPTSFTSAMATLVKLARTTVATAATQPTATPETPTTPTPSTPTPVTPPTPMPSPILVPRN